MVFFEAASRVWNNVRACVDCPAEGELSTIITGQPACTLGKRKYSGPSSSSPVASSQFSTKVAGVAGTMGAPGRSTSQTSALELAISTWSPLAFQGPSRVKVTGVSLADVTAYRAWEARRVAAARKAIAAADAARGGFHQSVKLTRGQDRQAREHLERAMTRLKECLVARGKRDPRLTLSATLRLAVSRPRNPAADGLLAVRVVSKKGLAPARDCVAALDLIEIPAPTEFEAIADVSYSGGAR